MRRVIFVSTATFDARLEPVVVSVCAMMICNAVISAAGLAVLVAALLALWWCRRRKTRSRGIAPRGKSSYLEGGYDSPMIRQQQLVKLGEAAALTKELRSMYTGELQQYPACQQVSYSLIISMHVHMDKRRHNSPDGNRAAVLHAPTPKRD